MNKREWLIVVGKTMALATICPSDSFGSKEDKYTPTGLNQLCKKRHILRKEIMDLHNKIQMLERLIELNLITELEMKRKRGSLEIEMDELQIELSKVNDQIEEIKELIGLSSEDDV